MNQSTAHVIQEETSSNSISDKVMALFQFASLAVLTQGVLLLNQIVLLPIQLRVWGTETSAYWYSILAVAAVTGVADFGLRVAGHAELIRFTHDPSDDEARKAFAHLWAWIRILMLLTTSALLVGDFLFHHYITHTDFPLWRAGLMLGIALEVLLCVRVTYLDSQGLYRQSEAGYLIFAAARLFLSLGALLIFHAPPAVVGWIWLFTGVFGVLQQGRLCRKIGRLLLLEPIPRDLSFRTLAVTRHTMAEPCSNWARIQGPVVVLSTIAPPIAVVTYVALRAVFGAARTTIAQLARFASVEYIKLRHGRKYELAEMHLSLMMLSTAFFASMVAALVLADNGRLAGLLLNKLDLPIYQTVAVTFGLGNAFFIYQIVQAISRREGEVAEVAHRQYFYMVCAAVFAAIALVTKSMQVWLSLMAAADVLIAISFMVASPRGSVLRQTTAGWRGTIASATSSFFVVVMWLFIRIEHPAFLSGRGVYDILCTIAFLLVWILLVGLVDLCLVYGLRVRSLGFPAAVVDWVERLRAAKVQNE